MSNITLAVEDETLRKVRKLAVDRHTTLTAMVRDTLRQLAAREGQSTEEVIAQLRASFEANDVCIDKANWRREDLHARQGIP